MNTNDSGEASGLAYRNGGFLDSDDGRPLRILAEYLEPLYRFKREQIHDTVVFFGSARLREEGPLGCYYAEARELARRLTQWSQTLPGCCRFVVCSGGGGGIMEAANRGAADAGGRTIGLNIGLPHEQRPNPFISPGLSLEFHYFFMRKLWFSHLARALIVFPGGFGTLDEMMEVLTLCQTRKLDRDIPVLLYGPSYWREVINFDALVRHGMIDASDLELFRFVDSPDAAFALLKEKLPKSQGPVSPAFAKSSTSASVIAPSSPVASGGTHASGTGAEDKPAG
ncbi:MAG: TIGR00730 family Rossman fold protein [Myxococcota bacterium]